MNRDDTESRLNSVQQNLLADMEAMQSAHGRTMMALSRFMKKAAGLL
jgi:hypothetical protein